MPDIDEKIIIKKINPNDETVILLKKFFKDGAIVKKKAEIAEVESSKVAYAITSNKSGYIYYYYDEGDEIPVNKMLGVIKLNKDSKTNFTKNKKIKFQLTQKAKNFCKKNNISAKDIKNTNLTDLISLKDLKKFFPKDDKKKYLSKESKRKESLSLSISSNDLAVLKKVEESNNSIVPAYLIFENKLNKFKSKVKEISLRLDSAVSLVDLIIFAFSKKIENYPKMNCSFIKNTLIRKEKISAGIVYNFDEKLYNFTIKDSNLKKIKEICDERLKISLSLAKNLISKEYFHESSFSISMINSGNLVTHIPIIYPNNSFIIGVGSMMNSLNKLNFSICFDHRFLNGNYVNDFVNEALKYLLNEI